jgi:uncharacterized protein YjiS (DUF1127 family)
VQTCSANAAAVTGRLERRSYPDDLKQCLGMAHLMPAPAARMVATGLCDKGPRDDAMSSPGSRRKDQAMKFASTRLIAADMQTISSTRHVSGLFWRYWGAFPERRARQRLRAVLCDLSDAELMDIGTSRGEIDYVVSNRGIDPRGIRSAERVRYLPTVDGQIVHFQTDQYPETDFR